MSASDQKNIRKPISGLAARQTALRLLDACLRTGQPLDQAINAIARPGAKGLDGPDRALAIAIAQEVLRWMPDLDALIDSQTKQIIPDDAKARMVLRMALAQLLCLKTPPHAVIATALPMLEKGPKRLVHGVLGALWRLQPTLPDQPTLLPDVAARWGSAWGDDMTADAARALAAPPPLDLIVAEPETTAEWVQALEGHSMAIGHVRISRGGAVENLPGYETGKWWVQDLAASIAVRLLGNGEGRKVADLCAAPGGKTMQLASAGWSVTAVDSSAKRMERLSKNLERTGLAADLVVADALQWEPATPFDAILLDAPCSATGTFRRHPDVLHRIGSKQIAELTILQAAMLERAAGWLKSGGTLLYATCSLEPEEGEEQIDAFLTKFPNFSINNAHFSALPDGVIPNERGYVRTMPGLYSEAGGIDGFFIASMVKA